MESKSETGSALGCGIICPSLPVRPAVVGTAVTAVSARVSLLCGVAHDF